ncbi:Crp/Fnr family transcriptional regulator [Actinokineospora globicatena]|uniref:Crp/Fnr family transcriptional regulator n=1 Tax=Actinokineospora globicatena TaxID=103729 RepID=A0A9W6V8U4_9PSEU|nr:Crp/Fnr family transcriptional regulator [Actinokineospora globicatena]MCP2302770.1 cAMP-binding domain of CRP or a regulatory subunit of cAMP-dependent protein kinases [Actinokineospora globicatena]GLW75540.1 Crp/Fnr family transcriptional regulator [Actinokineospora globicatena]GLW82381.1 Crp/Fnr family transcriptional regulator [Actinokineospora globicatena]GLW91324.1 Crp/Fnr family transcriptional regulator [Actinokineospora globicatena]
MTTASRWPPASLLGGLDDRVRRELLGLGQSIRVRDGDRLLRAGDPATHVYLLLLGWFKVHANRPSGDEALIAVRSGGDLVGELAAFEGHPRTVSVRACGPGVVRRIDREDFLAFLTQHGPALRAVLRAISAKHRWVTRRLTEFAGYAVRRRVACVLAELLEKDLRQHSGSAIPVQLSQAELAALAGTSVPSVQRVLRQFRTEGLVETRYRRVVVTDVPGVTRLAGTEPTTECVW